MTAYECLPLGGLFILMPVTFDCTSNVAFLFGLLLLLLLLPLLMIVVVVTLSGAASIFGLFLLTCCMDAVVVIDVALTAPG